MHELSIAHDIVATVTRHLPTENRAPVRWVKLSVGVLNHLGSDSLRFCFEAERRNRVGGSPARH